MLVEKRQATEKDYHAGVAAREAARKAAEAAARAAAAAAAAARGANAAGWARPSAGYISSGYGMRYHPIYHSWRLHNGTDIAGQGCGAPIDAVHGGVVTYAGWNGTLGNYIQINHGDGTSSGYGHIVGGGILVGYGQSVAAGQEIARVGSTGASTGCHLHFMIRINGALRTRCRSWPTAASASAAAALQPLDRRQHLRQRLLRVAEEQRRLGFVEQLVLDPGETGAHGALEEDDLLGVRHIQDRHAVDRRARASSSRPG